MSDTPETDAAVLTSDWGWSLVLKETCRRLERERDKAEAGWSECREFAQRMVDERDEARRELDIQLESIHFHMERVPVKDHPLRADDAKLEMTQKEAND